MSERDADKDKARSRSRERLTERARGGVETERLHLLQTTRFYAITFSPLMDSWDIICGGKVCGLGYYNGPSSPRIGKLKKYRPPNEYIYIYK